MTERERRHLHATIRGLLLRKWDREGELLVSIASTLDPREPLAQDIKALAWDSAWVKDLPEFSEEGIEWSQRRSAIVKAASKRVC